MAKMTDFRKELLDYLERPRAHISFEKAAAGMPVALMNRKPRGVPYTPWGLVEHIRVSQRDMIDLLQIHRGMWPNAPNPANAGDRRGCRRGKA